MVVDGTPVEHYPDLGLWVKREDLCCPGGPNFSKTRGVYAHVAKRSERVIGVLDTNHSQGGWAVARACSLLGKECVNFFPIRRAEARDPNWGLAPQQIAARDLGAEMVMLPAGRSAVLYHGAKKHLQKQMDQCCDGPGPDAYMMPNALKLPEMVIETAAEVARTALPDVETILVSASSGTIAAGVLRGLRDARNSALLLVHLGYSRSGRQVERYIFEMAGVDRGDPLSRIRLVDEGYKYGEPARWRYAAPPFPSNRFYDLKAFQWWVATGRARYGEALLWNVG